MKNVSTDSPSNPPRSDDGVGKSGPTPQQKIMRAAKRGMGLRLSDHEVWKLSRDGAIAACAANDDEDDAEGRK